MSAPTGRFAPPSEQDVTRLVREYPFAWVVSQAPGEYAATPLPLRPVVDAEGRVAEIHGHFARSNPQVALIRRHPEALLLFMGPHGYISSSWLRDRARTPTWNYAIVQYRVRMEFVEDGAATNELMRDLVGAMEQGRPDAWSISDMGERYPRIVTGIVGFHAHILERRVRFKLGQDERDAEYADIAAALAAGGEDTLLEWMNRSNPARG